MHGTICLPRRREWPPHVQAAVIEWFGRMLKDGRNEDMSADQYREHINRAWELMKRRLKESSGRKWDGCYALIARPEAGEAATERAGGLGSSAC